MKRKRNNPTTDIFILIVAGIICLVLTGTISFTIVTSLVLTVAIIGGTIFGIVLWIRHKNIKLPTIFERKKDDDLPGYISVPLPPPLPPNIFNTSSVLITKRFRRRHFMTKTELDFYNILKITIPSTLTIQSHIGLWAIVHHVNQEDWNKISQKHIDFILYDAINNHVALAIELDDPSHDKPETQKRDSAKNEILEDAGIPLLRIKSAKNYNIVSLRNQITQKIKQK